MEKSNKVKKIMPYLAAFALFLIASLIYCYPVLEGKTIQAGDEFNGRAAVQESVEYRQETGDITWWTGAMFSGMPNYQIGGGRYLSTKLMNPIWRLTHPSSAKMPLVFLTFFCCFFIMLRSFGVDKWLSIVGAFATGFSSYFFIIEAAGHNGKAWSIMLMSVVVGGFYLIYKKRYGWGIPLTMIFTAMGFSPHPQMAYYIFLLIGILFFTELYIHINEKRLKDFAIATLLFAGSVGVGLGTGTANIFANNEYAKETMRGGHSELVKEGDSSNKTKGLDLDYATAWSYGIDETLTFLIPGYMGTASGYNVGTESKLYEALVKNGVSKADAKAFCQSTPTYWGEQPFTVGSVYMGAIVCLLFVLGLFILKGPYKWGLLVATLFSVALSWGHNFMWLTEVFFNYFPLYDKFRAVSSILIVAEVTMPLLGFLAVKQFMEGSVDKKCLTKSLYFSTGIVGGICLIMALFGGALCDFKSSYDASFSNQIPAWVYQAIIAERADMLRSDSFRSLLFVLASGALIWSYVNLNLIKRNWMIAILGILVFADMWPVNKRFLNDDNFATPGQMGNFYAIQPYEQALLQDKDPHFRVFNVAANTFNEARTSYRLKSIGGYSAAKLRRYQDIIDQYLSKMDLDIVSMLNGKYIIVSDENGQVVPQRNPYAMGNAWYVDSIMIVDTPNEECAALGQINISNTAVLDRKFADFVKDFKPVNDSTAGVKLNAYSPKELTYTSNAKNDGTVVFSEIYYQYGWKAFIDGNPTEIFRVNYLLRAINVPAGTHQISMIFDPDSVKKGNILSAIFVVIMYATVLSFVGAAILRRRKRSKLSS